MKKYIIVAALVSLVGSLAMARSGLPTPTANSGNALATADYGGVSRATAAFTSSLTLAFSGEGVVYGFVASSGASSADYIQFCDTPTATTNDKKQEFARVYISSSVLGTGAVQQWGTTYMFPKPIRVNRGLAFKPSSALYNMITVLYYDWDQ